MSTGTTRKRASMWTSFLANHFFRPQTSSNQGPVGHRLCSRWMQSSSCSKKTTRY
ncbi:UNVERIFIED_CONTAM: hypothetical protein GTU68_051772 [Idotea baltica]|nr:hypothetical protein [Idotea baltica]